MILIAVISFLLLILLWILLVPVIIYVDTQGQKYQMSLPGMIRARVVPQDALFDIRGRILFIPFRFNPFTSSKGRKRSRAGSKRKTRAKKGGKGLLAQVKQGGRLGRHFLGAFRIRRLWLNIDTDDFMLNAYLLPVFTSVNREQIRMQVNFEGHASLILDLRIRLGGLLWAFAKTKYQHTFNS